MKIALTVKAVLLLLLLYILHNNANNIKRFNININSKLQDTLFGLQTF